MSPENVLREVQWRIGRNLIAYQHIELRLKIILPYIHPKGSAESVDAWRNLRKSLKSKTLGPVIQRLAKSVKLSGNKEAISAIKDEFSRIVDDRNELAHGLLKIPGMSLQSAEGRKRVCEHLDNNFAFAQSFNALVTELTQHTVQTLQQSLKGANHRSH